MEDDVRQLRRDAVLRLVPDAMADSCAQTVLRVSVGKTGVGAARVEAELQYTRVDDADQSHNADAGVTCAKSHWAAETVSVGKTDAAPTLLRRRELDESHGRRCRRRSESSSPSSSYVSEGGKSNSSSDRSRPKAPAVGVPLRRRRPVRVPARRGMHADAGCVAGGASQAPTLGVETP